MTGRFYQQLTADLSIVPGVESVGAGSDLPWTGWDENAGGFTIEGKKPRPGTQFHARYHMATPGYFSALGVPLIGGRFFNDGDTETSLSIILVNRAMADPYWPGENAIGKRMTFEDNPKEKDWMTIVGEVGDIKDQPNSPTRRARIWWPESQAANPDMSIVLRSNSNPDLLSDAVRNEVSVSTPSWQSPMCRSWTGSWARLLPLRALRSFSWECLQGWQFFLLQLEPME